MRVFRLVINLPIKMLFFLSQFTCCRSLMCPSHFVTRCVLTFLWSLSFFLSFFLALSRSLVGLLNSHLILIFGHIFFFLGSSKFTHLICARSFSFAIRCLYNFPLVNSFNSCPIRQQLFCWSLCVICFFYSLPSFVFVSLFSYCVDAIK